MFCFYTLCNNCFFKKRERALQIKTTARNFPTTESKLIVQRAKRNLTEAELISLPKDPSLARAVQRARLTEGGAGVNKAEAADVVWSDEFTTTNNRERFLILDSRDLDPLFPVFFVFASPAGTDMLRDNSRWSIDGTFYCCPPSFKQLFTINVFKGDSSMAAAFFLLPGKSAEIYDRAINAFFDLPDLVDVEPTAIMAGMYADYFGLSRLFCRRFA